MRETDHYIGDLHTGIVDVVLDIDFSTRITQQPDKCVSQHRIPQVADMRRLVGINTGVLNQNLARGYVSGRPSVSDQRRGHPSAIDFDIQIAGRRNLHLRDALDRADPRADRFGDL